MDIHSFFPPSVIDRPELRSVLLACLRQLEAAGVDSPRLSAEILLAESLGSDRNDLLKELLLYPERMLTKQEFTRFASLALRRAAGEPAALILGRKEFYGREFAVTRDTLIPRPETELLIDLALEHAAARGKGDGTPAGHTPLCFADMGAGSGCIAVTLALELPAWRGVALDISPAALAVARKNAARLGAGALHFVHADFSAPPLGAATLDMLVSNPPYVSAAEYAEVSREVRDFEPKSALVPGRRSGCGPKTSPNRDPGCGSRAPSNRAPAPEPETAATGLEDAACLIALAGTLLSPGGLLLMEIGCTQTAALLPRFDRAVWADAGVRRDLAGRDRVLEARKA